MRLFVVEDEAGLAEVDLVKPFASPELAARMRALVRRRP
jgi:hypothetical protein